MSKPKILSATNALDYTIGRVLLINPPVVDTRYEWIKWNQPLDLLKLSTVLKEDYKCHVKLFDFMLPNPSGIVPRRQSRIEFDLPYGEPTRWHFGKSWDTFDTYLDELVSEKWLPDSVWITTLTSFWWQTVPLVADRVKNKIKHPTVVLCGNYPILETQHATHFCPNVDIIINKKFGISTRVADFSLYGDTKLSFNALDIDSSDPLREISEALERGTSHFVFFNENLFLDFDTRLKPILKKIVEQGRDDIHIHGICGVETKDFPLSHSKLLAEANFSELHFEPALLGNGYIDEPLYRTVMESCEQAGFVQKRGKGWEAKRNYISGFLLIGHPNDELDRLVWNALKLHQLIGMVIPKPYSPTPGTDEYKLLESLVEYLEPEDISPHRFAFAEKNNISRNDYIDLYRMTAFLNKKVRGQTFDFLGNTFLAKVIQESIEGKRWDILTGEKFE